MVRTLLDSFILSVTLDNASSSETLRAAVDRLVEGRRCFVVTDGAREVRRLGGMNAFLLKNKK